MERSNNLKTYRAVFAIYQLHMVSKLFNPCRPWFPHITLCTIQVFLKQNRSFILCAVGFPGGSVGKESSCNMGDPGLIPGLGRSPGEGNDNPL